MPQPKHAPELKLLLGVAANERVDTSPQPTHREPKRPPGMTTVERVLWEEVTAELRDMDMLSSADGEEIRAYVQVVALSRRLHAELSKASSLSPINLDTGVVHAHPLIASYDRTIGRAHVLASALGLNPHGRSLIHGRTVTKPDTEAANVKDLYA